MDEFDLIERFFRARTAASDDVVVNIGDDGAVVGVPDEHQLVLTMDTLVEGVHFGDDASPASIGHKLAAVNLSDLAAMGSDPAWSLLSLTIPEVDENWLDGFSCGLHDLLGQYDVALVGGDTTRGPLSICLQLVGTVPPGQFIPRSGARPGDAVFVSGLLGGAALALAMQEGRVVQAQGGLDEIRRCLYRPEPRVELGVGLRNVATACIDISDGLAVDLGHISRASRVGMEIELDALPIPTAYREYLSAGGDWGLVLAGGDDYELAFSLPTSCQERLLALGRQLAIGVTRIGTVTSGEGVVFLQPDGSPLESYPAGYNHFRGSSSV